MPRTPAPLTVAPMETSAGLFWAVFGGSDGYRVGTFKEEADARAFVALPALLIAVNDALAWAKAGGPMDWTLIKAWREQLGTALAQADGPKEQP